ncbi:hypothetical protein MTO96_028537 [Rhipicephalus appendiculatus]
MLTSRLVLALLLLTTLATLPSPTDGMFFGGGLGAYLLPAALIGLPLPLGPLALGIGVAGIKVAIFTRILRFLAGVLGSRGDAKRGITVRKEFVHVPAKNIHRAIRPLVEPPPVPRTLAHAPFVGPQPYGFPGGIPPTAFAGSVLSPFEVPVRQPFIFPPSKFASPPPPPSFQFVFPPAPPQAEVRRRPTQFLSPDKILQGGQPVTGGTFDQLLRIAQSPAVSNIVSNNPDLVVKFLRGIAGPKPLPTSVGTAHSTAGLTGSKIGGGDIEALLNFVREDPNLVRNIVRADPEFVPSLVNNILGIQGQASQPTPAPPANFTGFDFKQPSNDTEGGDKSSDDVPANVPVETTQDKALVRPSNAPKNTAEPPPRLRSHYSFQSYPPNFYTLPNYGPSPYNTFGFPAGFGGPQRPAGFFGGPWRPATPQRVLNLPKFTDYINQATELTYGQNNRLNKQQSTEVRVPGSVPKDKPETAPAVVVTTKQPEKFTLDAYGPTDPFRKINPKISTTAFTTPHPLKRPSVPAYVPEPESSSPKEQPAPQTYGPTKAKPSYQGEVVAKAPATQGYKAPSKTGRPAPSYTPSSSDQSGTKPKGDVYTSAGQDQQVSAGWSERPAAKKTVVPPPVRPVFVPATGKFRLDKDQKGSPEANVGSFPASLFDPTAFDGKDTKDSSQTSGPAKPRARRDTFSTPTTTSLMDLLNLRTMDSRKYVDSVMLNGGEDLAADYNRAYEVGRTHGGEGCRIKYNSCPMTVVDLVSLSANFG